MALIDYEREFAEVRKKTPFRNFLMEIASFQPITLYRRSDGVISRYPETDRLENVITKEQFSELRDGLVRTTQSARSDQSLFEVFGELFRSVATPAMFSSHNGENSEYSDC